MKEVIKKALKMTLPVFAGYVVLGMAFGILLVKGGTNPIYAPLMAFVIYGGSAQYVSISLLAAKASLLQVFIVEIALNFRHIFYGISMLQKYSGLGKLKPLAIFGLTDETFSILVSEEYEPETKKKLILTVSLLDHSYWIIGCTIGAFLYQVITINLKGLEFVLTALFIVIMLDQLMKIKNKYLPFIGIVATIVSLFVFKDNFVIPSLLIILAIMLVLRKPFERMEGDTIGY